MEEQIIDIVLECTKKKMLLSEEVIEHIVNLLKKDRGLDTYLDKVEFTYKKSGIYYKPSNKTIYFDFCVEIPKAIKNNLFMVNLYYLSIILHEIEHVCQFKYYFENKKEDLKDSLDKYRHRIIKEFRLLSLLGTYNILKNPPTYDEYKLMKNLDGLSNPNFSQKLNFEYGVFHDTFLCEREADIESYTFIINSLRKYYPKSDAYQYFEYLMKNRYLDLYFFINGKLEMSPLSEYLRRFGYKEIKSETTKLTNNIKKEYPDLSIEKRMEYGLDVEYDEFYEFASNCSNKRLKKIILRDNAYRFGRF